ncbi:lipopolysaccharide biosynthesis protein [Cryobacterium sp. PH31-AA6]|uniref:lipopolysaccharide biosynthesis protein n=1 Tax=Cryobacterium sp. PH31-AA6 TaxID=3046205 RepID=UPI0024BA10B3|nr:lipopolysaccharide biosynthesis protein [Cryobacterium sp. PH31-AA6]MDJ0323731.1 lipopolysaccharide biosynthesis protein [Cryobacterium sp. PH31-AA6]
MTPLEQQPAATTQAAPSVSAQTAAGVLWLTVQKWVVRLSGFVTIAILTRFLSPAEFGTVAAATVVLPFFYLLADLGFTAYIVQAESTGRRMLSTGFWFSMLAGLLLCAAVVGIAPLVGLVFSSDEVVPVLQVLALAVVLTAVSSVPTALLRRAMRFRALAIQGTIAAIAAQVVAITMVVTGFGVWALVGQTLTALLVTAVLAWVAAAWLPSLAFSRSEFSTMARFGSQVLGVEFVNVGRALAETAIITATLGLTGLGYLSIAQRIVQIVQDLTGAALLPVSTVAFSRIRDAAERLRAAYVRALRMTYAIMSPPLIVVAVAAPLIIPIVFGDGWADSGRVAQILALAGIMVVGATLDHGLFYGLGKPGRWFVYALIIDACTVGTTAVMVQWGLDAIAWGFLVIAGIATVIRWFLVAKLLQASPRTLAGPFGLLAALALTGGGTGWVVLVLSTSLPPMVRIALIGLAVTVVSIVVIRLLARQIIVEVAGLLPRFNRAIRVRIASAPKEQA